MTGPVVTLAGASDEAAAETPEAAPVPASSGLEAAIATAGRKARRKRWWDMPLDLELGPEVLGIGLRLGLPTDSDDTIIDDEEEPSNPARDIAFLAHALIGVVILGADGKYKPTEEFTVRDIASIHAAAMDDAGTRPTFDTDASAIQQLLTIGDPPAVNVQYASTMARTYRRWAMTGATEDGEPDPGA